MAGVRIEGSRVLLTGASSGIGRHLAKRLARGGATLAVSARREALLQSLAEEIAADELPAPVVLPADLSRRGAAAGLARRAEEALGGVDVLINNAGGGAGGQIASVGDRDEGRHAFEVNYWSPLALVRALAPAMQERGSGAIVNVTSMSKVVTWPGFGAYAVTKAAFGLATETLALEMTGTGVHVMEALPGPIDTAVQGETRLAPGIERMLSGSPLGDPDRMARHIVRGLERGRRRVIYPRRVAVAHYLPRVAAWHVGRQASKTMRELDAETRAWMQDLVVVTGSHGDELTRQARDEWERSRGRAA